MAYKTNAGGVSALKQDMEVSGKAGDEPSRDAEKEAREWLKKNARTHPDGDALFTGDASGNEITKSMLGFAKGKVSGEAHTFMKRMLETYYDQEAVLTDYKIFGL